MNAFRHDIVYGLCLSSSNQNRESMNKKVETSFSDVVGKHNGLILMLWEQYSNITVKELRRGGFQSQIWGAFDSAVKWKGYFWQKKCIFKNKGSQKFTSAQEPEKKGYNIFTEEDRQ